LKGGFQNVGGLNNGTDVRVGGIHRGAFKEIAALARTAYL